MPRQKKVSSEQVAKTGGKTLTEQIEKSRSRSKSYVMDLRVHSPASLGYLGVEGLDSAPAIVRLAKVKGIDVIAITDFFSGEFVDRMVAAAKNSPLTVIPGVDLRCKLGSCDDVLLTCLFSEQFTTADINNFLNELQVPVRIRGNKGYVLDVSLDHVMHTVEKFQGAAPVSRMDKTPHRMSVVPELVETYGFRAFDLAYADSVDYFKRKWPKIKFQLFTFSDANALAQIGSRIARVKLSSPGFAGIRQIVARDSLSGEHTVS